MLLTPCLSKTISVINKIPKALEAKNYKFNTLLNI